MDEGAAGAVDLFGDPVPANRGRAGRPEHSPTAKNRAFVTMLLAIGNDPKTIAQALGITMPTLRKHYFSELEKRSVARLRVKGHMLASAAEQAKAGNVGAIKFVSAEMDKAALGFVPDRAKPVKEKPLGIKEERKRAAYEAGRGTGWDELTRH